MKALCLAFLCALVACDKPTAPVDQMASTLAASSDGKENSEPENESLAREVEKLKVKVQFLEADLRLKDSKLEDRISILEGEMRLLRNKGLFMTRLNGVFLEAGKKEFSGIEAGFGNLLVMCEKVEPYLTGHKVTLSVGNPLLATVSNFSGKLTCVEDGKLGEVTAFRSSKEIPPGSWGSIEITVLRSTPQSIERFFLELLSDSVKMKNTP